MVAEDEETVVAELELLGIRYLSRRIQEPATRLRPPGALIADLIRQPNARVRGALIAVMLAHPEYASAIPDVLACLPSPDQWNLRVLYTAAMLLQQEYSEALRPYLTTNWCWLPDLFSSEIGVLVSGTPRQRLVSLGARNRCHTQQAINWAGTYDNVVQHLLRSWRLEALWSH